MDALIGRIDDALRRGEPVSLSLVIGRRGSLPMSRRAKMAVFADGSSTGTVGGGCLEAEVYARGRELLRDGGAAIDTYSLVEVEQGLQGHVCGGTVTLLSIGLTPAEPTRGLVRQLHERITRRQPATLVLGIPECGRSPAAFLALVTGQQVMAAPDEPLKASVIEHARESLEEGRPIRWHQDDRQYWLEPVVPRPRVLVFGAGHCGRAIGALAATAGFRVWMLDDRDELLEPERLPWAEERLRVQFPSCLDSVPVDHETYAVIVTRGHAHDLDVLRQLLPRRPVYLGMIGSRRKWLLFEKTLHAEGVERDRLATVRSPMGLDIGADTPEEIAVSVVAEMIATRRRSVPPPVRSEPKRENT